MKNDVAKNHGKSIFFYIVKWIIITAGCILCAYCLEKFVFQRSAHAEEALNVEFSLEELEQTGFSYENGELISTGRYAQIVLPAGGYIYNFHMKYQTENMQKAVWSTEQQSDYANLDTQNAWNVDCRTQSLDRIIGVQGEKLVVTFLEIGDSVCIKEISFTNDCPFHMQRFVFVAAILMAVAAIAVGFKNFEEHPERIVSVVCLMLGIAMLAGVPYDKNSWDDESHFATAYRLSYTLIGQDTQWTQAADDFRDLELPFTYSYQERLNTERRQNETAKIDTRSEKSGGIAFALSNIRSLPAAIGILIGRTVGMEFSRWFILARLFNLLFYTVVLYFAIKIVPVGKSLMAFLALLPTPVFLTVSYNTDYFLNVLVMLAMAVFFKELFTPEKKIEKKSAAIFMLAMIFACMGKPIYIPLILVGLLLPADKFEGRRGRRIFGGLLLLCGALVLLFVMIQAPGMSDPRGGDTSVSGQIAYILHNPVSFAVVFIKEIAKSSIEFVLGCDATLNYNIIGKYDGGNAEIIMLITMLVLIVHAKGKGKEYEIDWKKRVLGLGIIGLVVCFIWGSMYLAYTPVGSNLINGVQPRYYIPFLFLLFMLLPTGKIRSFLTEKVAFSLALGVVVLLHTVSVYNLMILQ